RTARALAEWRSRRQPLGDRAGREYRPCAAAFWLTAAPVCIQRRPHARRGALGGVGSARWAAPRPCILVRHPGRPECPAAICSDACGVSAARRSLVCDRCFAYWNVVENWVLRC